MAKPKATWASAHDYKPRKKDGLMGVFLLAVHETCKAQGWDWRAANESPTFAKVEAWKPDDSGKSSVTGVDILLDTDTPGKSVRVDVAWTVLDADRRLAQHFGDSFVHRAGTLARQWAKENGQAQEVAYLLTGKRPISAGAQTAKQAAPVPPQSDAERGPNTRTQERFAAFDKLKVDNPGWTQAKVALEASMSLGEQVTPETVRNTYRLMGKTWQRADRIR